MANKIEKWQPVHEDDVPSPSEAVLEFARVLNERLQLTDGMMEDIGRGVIADLMLDPPRSVAEREAEGREKRGSQSVFEFEETYTDAVERTDRGLAPIAVRLIDIPSTTMIPDPYYANEVIGDCHELAGLIMTTFFNDPSLDGRWGWARIPYETREKLLLAVQDRVGTGVWAFMSQRWVDAEVGFADTYGGDEMKPSEAVYGFAAYLSGLEEKLTVGASCNAAALLNAVQSFNESQKFTEPGSLWADNLRPYPSTTVAPPEPPPLSDDNES